CLELGEVHDANAFETVELDANAHRSPLPLRPHADHHAHHSGGQLTAPIAVGRSHAIPGSPSRPIRRPSAWRSRGDKTPGSLPDCPLTLQDSPKALEIPVTPVFVAEGLSHNFWPLDPWHPVYQAW